MRTLLIAGLLLLAVSGASLAAGSAAQPADIVAQQKAIRAEVDAQKGRFQDMPSVKRKRIAADQDRLFALLDGKSDMTELDAAQQTEVSALLASIDGAIANKEDERMVCTREQRTGSNFTTKVCRSVAQIEAEKRSADRDMKDMTQKICNDKGCF